LISPRTRALFIVCGGGESPRTQEYVNVLATSCGAKPSLTKIFPGRVTKRLLTPEDYKVQEDVARRRNQPLKDYDRLRRSDCLKFGEEITRKM
jgi:hypothetical protein